MAETQKCAECGSTLESAIAAGAVGIVFVILETPKGPIVVCSRCKRGAHEKG